MRAPRLTNQEGRLLQLPAPGRFGAAELAGLPEPVRRHLAAARGSNWHRLAITV